MESRTFAPTIKGILATGLLLATTVTTLLAQPGKLAPDLANLDPNESVDVIIQLEDTPASRPGAPRPSRPLALGGVNLASQRPVRELGLINGLVTRLPAAALASLATDPRVKYISPDRPVSAALQNAIPAVNANVAQAAGFDGRGIGIAVIDSGVSEHADLKNDACTVSRVVYRQNFTPSDFAPEVDVYSDPEFNTVNTPDLYGHGTHVAGILAGNGRCSAENNGKAIINGVAAPQTRLIGVAPRAHLIDLRALNSVGAGTDSAVTDKTISASSSGSKSGSQSFIRRNVIAAFAPTRLLPSTKAWFWQM
jgi:serine protease AprX